MGEAPKRDVLQGHRLALSVVVGAREVQGHLLLDVRQFGRG